MAAEHGDLAPAVIDAVSPVMFRIRAGRPFSANNSSCTDTHFLHEQQTTYMLLIPK